MHRLRVCPSEAIRITLVEMENVRRDYSRAPLTSKSTMRSPQSEITANPFLPGSPDPTVTLPTTRYLSTKPLPADLLAGDAHEAKLQPAHLPLVWMLVLTQLGAGGFFMLPISARAAQPALAVGALTATLLGLAGSVLHLGRPQKAWRVFLGLRRSWMSREIIVFGIFAFLAAITTLTAFADGSKSWKPALFWTTSLVGLLGVFCSGMTYHVTRRECWHGELSVGRFCGAVLVLGSAAACCASSLSGNGHNIIAIVLPLATLTRLSREFAFLRLCPDDADLGDELPASLLARSAFLMRFRLGGLLRCHIACAWLGGVVLPLLVWLPQSTCAPAVAGLALCLAGEFAERVLFFRTAVVAKMPGGVAT